MRCDESGEDESPPLFSCGFIKSDHCTDMNCDERFSCSDCDGCGAAVAGGSPSRFSDYHSDAARARRAFAEKFADEAAHNALVAAWARGAESQEASAAHKSAWLSAYEEFSGL